jgi:hypothetical protein
MRTPLIVHHGCQVLQTGEIACFSRPAPVFVLEFQVFNGNIEQDYTVFFLFREDLLKAFIQKKLRSNLRLPRSYLSS